MQTQPPRMNIYVSVEVSLYDKIVALSNIIDITTSELCELMLKAQYKEFVESIKYKLGLDDAA